METSNTTGPLKSILNRIPIRDLGQILEVQEFIISHSFILLQDAFHYR